MNFLAFKLNVVGNKPPRAQLNNLNVVTRNAVKNAGEYLRIKMSESIAPYGTPYGLTGEASGNIYVDTPDDRTFEIYEGVTKTSQGALVLFHNTGIRGAFRLSDKIRPLNTSPQNLPLLINWLSNVAVEPYSPWGRLITWMHQRGLAGNMADWEVKLSAHNILRKVVSSGRDKNSTYNYPAGVWTKESGAVNHILSSFLSSHLANLMVEVQAEYYADMIDRRSANPQIIFNRLSWRL